MTRWYLDLADQILKGLCAQTQPSLVRFVEAAGHLLDWDMLFMQTAYCIEPAALSPAFLIKRLPYTRPGSFLEGMRSAAKRGWLFEKGGKFQLTDAGYEVVDGVFALSDRLHGKIKVLSNLDMERLLSLSDGLIHTINTLPETVEKPVFELGLRYTRSRGTPLVVQIRYRILTILAFRDDAHAAAWHPWEQDGRLWETFTLVWRGEAGSAEQLAALLPHRNYIKSDYASALEKLSARDWITNRGDGFIVQEQAAGMCREVEEITDRLFDAAFCGLSQDEMRTFQSLMGDLAAATAPPKERAGLKMVTSAEPDA